MLIQLLIKLLFDFQVSELNSIKWDFQTAPLKKKHPKWSSFTHPQIVPNHIDFVALLKKDIGKNICNQTVLGTIVGRTTMAVNGAPELLKWWQKYDIWVNYSFKVSILKKWSQTFFYEEPTTRLHVISSSSWFLCV